MSNTNSAEAADPSPRRDPQDYVTPPFLVAAVGAVLKPACRDFDRYIMSLAVAHRCRKPECGAG